MIKIRMATEKEVEDIMLGDDEFSKRVNDMNISAAAGRFYDHSLTKKDFKAVMKDTIMGPNEGDEEKCKAIQDEINKRVKTSVDEEILIIRSRCMESFGFPYTKSNAIVIPYNEDEQSILGHLCLPLVEHELFHIKTRLNPKIRDSIYATLGFERGKVEIIPEINKTIVINPDAMDFNHSIAVRRKNGRNKIRVAPYIGMRKSFEFDLLMVLDDGLKTTGEIIRHRDTDINSRIPLVGYISHPEEASAEYFRLALTGTVSESRQLNNFKKAVEKEMGYSFNEEYFSELREGLRLEAERRQKISAESRRRRVARIE